jgi:hypothetical protein
LKTIWKIAVAAALGASNAHGAAPKSVPLPMVTASDPATIMSALASAGYVPTLSKDNDGDPMITFTKGPTFTYHVYFMRCVNHVKCGGLQLYFEYGASLVTPQRINDVWYTEFATPSIIFVTKPKGNLGIYSYILTEPGGLSRPLFLATVNLWFDNIAQAYTRFAKP